MRRGGIQHVYTSRKRGDIREKKIDIRGEKGINKERERERESERDDLSLGIE